MLRYDPQQSTSLMTLITQPFSDIFAVDHIVETACAKKAI